MTALGALPQGNDSSGHSSVHVSALSKTRCALWFQIHYKQALEIPPAIFMERIFTAMEHNTLLQLKISAEKQVVNSAVSYQI